MRQLRVVKQIENGIAENLRDFRIIKNLPRNKSAIRNRVIRSRAGQEAGLDLRFLTGAAPKQRFFRRVVASIILQAFRIDAINGNRSQVPSPPRSGGEGGRRPDEGADRFIVKRS